MKKLSKIKLNRGMTYVELIVVLSIFAVMSSVVMFNYGAFQDRVDIKNLASDIALQVVQAQNNSLSGILPPLAQQPFEISGWKPSYGVYFDTTSASNKKQFIYFVDLNNDYYFDHSDCPGVKECLNRITITKNNIISKLETIPVSKSCTTGVVTGGTSIPDLTIVFKRPDSGATMSSGVVPLSNFTCIQITISSPNNVTSVIKLYPSGRVQIN